MAAYADGDKRGERIPAESALVRPVLIVDHRRGARVPLRRDGALLEARAAALHPQANLDTGPDQLGLRRPVRRDVTCPHDHCRALVGLRQFWLRCQNSGCQNSGSAMWRFQRTVRPHLRRRRRRGGCARCSCRPSGCTPCPAGRHRPSPPAGRPCAPQAPAPAVKPQRSSLEKQAELCGKRSPPETPGLWVAYGEGRVGVGGRSEQRREVRVDPLRTPRPQRLASQATTEWRRRRRQKAAHKS